MRVRLQRPITVDGRVVARVRVTATNDTLTAALLAEPDPGRQIARTLMAVTGLDEAAICQLEIEDGLRILDRLKAD